ncbi:acyl-protein synthetase [Roseospira marina]|uniref:Acyl-protein synthetase n=1 Tax=Roseospira marina TaxID=140057 RepID=A0A5M6IC57_9PROT|nr:acyl-protein synthetase [Roseospira marina]KAA5605208.1 acyl-protein synthetase [Roseospira marina]MBB4314662.1 phenylacetate-coenzyme A ligase PaaK-like adenylate-forming protein [Roseospira marina]MBB5087651.1 phenylacetate-coenzyme A ligase PaaK-like adenylate-forming protein [Roseospira marina]
MPESHDPVPVTDWPAFGLAGPDKRERILAELRRLTRHHRDACPPYRAIVDKLGFPTDTLDTLEDVPFLPVRLFKRHRLLSVPDGDVVKTMTSSGTSGQSRSQIVLDKTTSALQVKVLSRIMAEVIGPKRLPMLVIDGRATVADRYRFSARTAGILGFSMFGRDVAYALNDDMTLNREGTRAFLDKHAGQDILVFGFTFIVWRHLIRALEEAGESLPLEGGILIHGGGWKQLLAQAVAPDAFRARVAGVTGMTRVHNYYGMVEQTGSIFMECGEGRLHASAWSEIVIRDPGTFAPLPPGESGLVQLLSVLPHSYPGHSLLSEDVGHILGRDDCPCGRAGTTLRIEGRLEHAEIRGCSDTYPP